MEGALGVVLVCGRSTERGHHRVADELLDRAAGALDLGSHCVVEAVEHDPRPLRILRAPECRRADEIGEEYGRDLPLSGGLRVAPDRRGAARTEARPLREDCTALLADSHEEDCPAPRVRPSV